MDFVGCFSLKCLKCYCHTVSSINNVTQDTSQSVLPTVAIPFFLKECLLNVLGQ